MQEESGSHEAVEADQREQIKAEVPRCMHEDVLKSRGALHIQDGPGSSAWEWVRVHACLLYTSDAADDWLVV